MLALESGYYPPGAEFDKRAPWNQPETPEPVYAVQEWVPPNSISPKGYWARVDPADFDQPHEVDADDLLAACRAAQPETKFELYEVEA